MDKHLKALFVCLGRSVCEALTKNDLEYNEIRIRNEKPIVVYAQNKLYFLNTDGLSETKRECLTLDMEQIKSAFSRLCEYSVYRHQGDINNGFITVRGGHRVGLCGTAVISGGVVKNVTNISSLNIRVAREYIGCSHLFFKSFCGGGSLIVGTPSSGKTTLLRDISRVLSAELYRKVSVIDERMEMSARFNGKEFFDLGLSDIYCGYTKKTAIFQAIRTMSPDYIICDELTGEDTNSVADCTNFGVNIIASVHCDSLENALKNPSICSLLNTGAFSQLVILDSKIYGKITGIYKTEELNLA